MNDSDFSRVVVNQPIILPYCSVSGKQKFAPPRKVIGHSVWNWSLGDLADATAATFAGSEDGKNEASRW